MEDIQNPPSQEDTSPQADLMTHLELEDPALFHCQVCSVGVSFHDRDWFTPPQESPATVFCIDGAPQDQCVIFADSRDMEHTVSLLHADTDMIVDSGFTITTTGAAGIRHSYVAHPRQASECVLPPIRWSSQRTSSRHHHVRYCLIVGSLSTHAGYQVKHPPHRDVRHTEL
jgi:hypothetical protein